MSAYAQKKALREAQLVLVEGRRINPNVPVHGVTVNGYVNYLCRCVECTIAWADATDARRQARKAKRVNVDGRLIAPIAEHGTESTYTNHGCRCIACTEAWRIQGRGA